MPNLSRRIEALEDGVPDKHFGAVILSHDQETELDAISRHEADHGQIDGEVFFIRLVELGRAA